VQKRDEKSMWDIAWLLASLYGGFSRDL